MQAHVQRMIEEQTQLAERVKKLDDFIHGRNTDGTFVNLPVRERRLLIEQLDAMTRYLQILSARIALT